MDDYPPMYCETCDRWEDDQIALECEICLWCGGPVCQPDDERFKPTKIPEAFDGQPDEAQEWHDYDPDC
jgi:hypothetical protein